MLDNHDARNFTAMSMTSLPTTIVSPGDLRNTFLACYEGILRTDYAM
jgi:hypothetical protein